MAYFLQRLALWILDDECIEHHCMVFHGPAQEKGADEYALLHRFEKATAPASKVSDQKPRMPFCQLHHSLALRSASDIHLLHFKR